MPKLKGKVAIVTGSSRGIGRDIAIGFAREGANIVVAARTETEIERLPGTIHGTVEEIRALGARTLAVKCSVADEQEVEAMVRKTLEEFGRVDILVNNAAVAFYAPLHEMPLKRWELVLRVNLTGTFLCSKAAIPAMIEQRSGNIVNISSVDATLRTKTPVFTGLAYGASKAAIERLTWGMAAELEEYNIAVNALKPRGAVDTPGVRFMNPGLDWSLFDSSDMMVKAAIFLASQDAGGVTGVVATDEELCARHGLT
ncbi:MAG: SDR family NAD(P)-dependent oxidoreductase [Dehalococcoidia bacterium]